MSPVSLEGEASAGRFGSEASLSEMGCFLLEGLVRSSKRRLFVGERLGTDCTRIFLLTPLTGMAQGLLEMFGVRG